MSDCTDLNEHLNRQPMNAGVVDDNSSLMTSSWRNHFHTIHVHITMHFV